MSKLELIPCTGRPDAKRPSIVFASGFMTEQEWRKKQGASWVQQVVQLAKGFNYNGLVLSWPSSSPLKAMAKVLAPESALVRIASALPEPVRPNRKWVEHPVTKVFGKAVEALLAPGVAANIGTDIIEAGIKGRGIWTRAVSEADAAARHLWALTSRLGPNVVLAGHSLGGRIVLRAAEAAGRMGKAGRYQAVIALAPAIEESRLDMSAVARGVRRKPVIVSSRTDDVLNKAFRAGEFTKEHALGFRGPSEASRELVCWVDMTESSVGHSGYRDQMAALLRERCCSAFGET